MTTKLKLPKKRLPVERPMPTSIRLPENLSTIIDGEASKRKISRNEMLLIAIQYAMDEFKRPELEPYKMIQGGKIVTIYDRTEDELVAVYLEDVDEQLHFSCDMHVGQESCEHIKFVRNIPTIKSWLKESEK